MKAHIEAFYNHLSTDFPEWGRGRVRYYNQGRIKDYSSLANHLSSMSLSDLKTLISDKHWNSYPLYCYGGGDSSFINTRRYFNLISNTVKHLVFASDKYRKLFIKESEGIFRIATINSCLGKDKLKAAKVGIKSGDARARKLSVSLVPVSDLTAMIGTETRSDIQNKISGRIGYLNMIPTEKKSRSRWNRSRAILNSEFNPDEMKEIIQRGLDGKGLFVYDRDLLTNLTYNVDASSAPFYLDLFQKLCESDAVMKQIFLKKLTGKSHV